MRFSSKRKSRILLESGTNEVEFMRFYLGTYFFGINVAKVRKAVVFDLAHFTETPGENGGLVGNYLERGECIPVLDLNLYMNIIPSAQSTPRLLLICEFNQFTMGFLIDRIKDIIRCSWKYFQTSAASKTSPHSHTALTGNVVFNDEITPILDVEAILAEVIPSAGIAKDSSKINLEHTEDTKPQRILYCEDSPTVQRVLLESLAKSGYNNVVTFSSGKEGYDYLVANPYKVDIVVSDIEMPQMDGLSFCKAVRDMPLHKSTPLVFFSSTVTTEMREKCTSVGGTAAFSKPEIQDLISYLDSMVRTSV